MKISRRQLLWGTAGTIAVAGGGYKLLRGFADEPTPQDIPTHLRRAALDIHVHILGVGTGGSGCWMNASMKSGLAVRVGLWNLGLRLGQGEIDQRYVDYLRSRIHGAGFLKQVVLLAHDYTYTERGERDPARTPFHTPNEYVARLAAHFPEFLFGASIHPYRRDALDELDRVASLGAVLVKWIPNVQAVELGDPRCRDFYRRMAVHRLPLLVHVGDERATFIAGQHYGDPRKLEAPLTEGLTVIAAHMASLGIHNGQSNFDLLADLLRTTPQLYADTSALTLLSRWRSLLRLAKEVDLHPRLVHGSDFPLPPATTLFLGHVPLDRWWDAWKHENPFRRDFEIKQAIGLSDEIYRRGYQVLAPRLAEPSPRGSAARPDYPLRNSGR